MSGRCDFCDECGTDMYCTRCAIGESLRVEKLEAANKILVEGLERIKKKSPQKVSRNEAADMACEFSIVAREALAKASEVTRQAGLNDRIRKG